MNTYHQPDAHSSHTSVRVRACVCVRVRVLVRVRVCVCARALACVCVLCVTPGSTTDLHMDWRNALVNNRRAQRLHQQQA